MSRWRGPVWQVYAWRVLPGGRGPEGGREDLEEVIAGVPVADRRGPVERVGVPRVGQDIPVEHPDRDAIPVVGEFPVRRLFRLRIADLAEQDEVISGIAALQSLWHCLYRVPFGVDAAFMSLGRVGE